MMKRRQATLGAEFGEVAVVAVVAASWNQKQRRMQWRAAAVERKEVAAGWVW
jgi:hypothetical protein